MHTSHGPSHTPDPKHNYEMQDVDPKSLLPVLFFMVAFVGVASFVSIFIFRHFQGEMQKHTTSYALPSLRPLPFEPRLQANPVWDIETLRRQEEDWLTSYSKDPITQRLHIPVERAMRIVAQEGLPTRSNPAQPDHSAPNEPSYTEGQAPEDTALMSHPISTNAMRGMK